MTRATLRFVDSMDAERLAALGTSCPDHFLRTKIRPLYVAWDPQRGDLAALKAALTAGLERYRNDYGAYYQPLPAAAIRRRGAMPIPPSSSSPGWAW